MADKDFANMSARCSSLRWASIVCWASCWVKVRVELASSVAQALCSAVKGAVELEDACWS